MSKLTVRAASMLVSAALAAVACAATADVAGADRAYDILPPGEFGGIPTTAHSTDQLPLYDGLTPLGGNVTLADIARLYKPETMRPIGASTVEATGRRGLTIRRDAFDVPHVYGHTRADVWFGSGWVAAEDRSLLAQLGRGPARAAVASPPGLNAFGLVTSGRAFVPSRQAESLVHSEQAALVRAYGTKGRQILRDIDAYDAGVNAYWRKIGSKNPPWTRDDTIAVTAFIGSIFGNGGGSEARNGQFLGELRALLGPRRGGRAFSDLMEANDSDAPTTIGARFPYGSAGGSPTAGSPALDPHSLQLAADPTQAQTMSNFLIVGSRRSANGNPLAVMGPQLGYYYPAIVLEEDLHGPGIHAQGAFVPGGGPYMLLGRTRNYAWSLTSASNDNRDDFAERLCNPDHSAPTRSSNHYIYRGRCRAMTTFDAGTLKGTGGGPDRELTFQMTVHGPVIGSATIGGRPYAITQKRSTYGRESLSMAALRDLTLGAGATVNGFYRAANEFGFTFNFGYVSRRHIAYFSSGLLPRRAPRLNRMLPTLGTGKYDWRGFIGLAAHPHAADPPSGLLLNWNNRPAPGWISGDDVHYSPVHRVQMYEHFPRKVRLQNVVSIMNGAATEDLRATQVWPLIAAVLAGSPAPDALTQQAYNLLNAWSRAGGSRLDRNLSGKVDDPGAAIMDHAFTKLATAVLAPVLGSAESDFAAIVGPDNSPSRSNGSAFGSGWYGYVVKDLRTLLHRKVKARYNLHYCGGGALAACRASLWAALQQAAAELAAQQGPNPSAWRSDATLERIHFVPNLIPNTMRWTNRSVFQQVLEFGRTG